MNAEYQRHKRVWELLKPKVYARVELAEPRKWTRPAVGVTVPEFLDWYPASMDMALLAHGHGELTSPLSEF
jgi:hypothetical protein